MLPLLLVLLATSVKPLPIVGTPECLLLDISSNEFRVSPGGYDTDSVTQQTCAGLCADSGFPYAGLQEGMYCLCSNDISLSTPVTLTDCSTPCSGDPSLFCGGPDLNHILAVVAGNTEDLYEALLTITPLNISAGESVSGSVSVNASSGLLIDVYLDFGDGTFTTGNATSLTFTKHYALPGTYIIRVSVSTPSGLLFPVSDEKTVNVVGSGIAAVLECPEVVQPGEEFLCNALINKGSDLLLELDFEDDLQFPQLYTVADPVISGQGNTVPDIIMPGMVTTPLSEPEVLMTYIEMPSGKLLAFEYYSTGAGSLDLLVFRPNCGGDIYCSQTKSCATTCTEPGIAVCQTTEALCPFSRGCVSTTTPPSCSLSSSGLLYDRLYTISVSPDSEGYHYHLLADDTYEVKPGDVLGFASGTSSIAYRSASASEITQGLVDSSSSAPLNVRHFLHGIVSEPVNITIAHVFSEVGNKSVSMTVSNSSVEQSVVVVEYVPVQIPITNLTLTSDPLFIPIGTSALLHVLMANGSSVTLIWNFGDGTVLEEFIDGIVNASGHNQTYTFPLEQIYLVTVNASNLHGTLNATLELPCQYPVSLNWELWSDSPQMYPPGLINASLAYITSDNLPTDPEGIVDFGDGTKQQLSLLNTGIGPWSVFLPHTYSAGGVYNLTVNLSNLVSQEVFFVELTINELISNVSVNVTYLDIATDPFNRQLLKGANMTDAVYGSALYFDISCTGTVSYYTMELDNGTLLLNSSTSPLVYNFTEPGVYNVSIYAWNQLQGASEIFTQVIRSMIPISGLQIVDSGIIPSPSEPMSIDVLLDQTDEFTCIVFSSNDGELPLAFGNLDMCLSKYSEAEIIWQSDLENPLRIEHSFENGGLFTVDVEVFNSVSYEKQSITIQVAQMPCDPPVMWIEDNSTIFTEPVEKMRGKMFRLVGNVKLVCNLTVQAEREWKAQEIDSSGNSIGNVIDLSDLLTWNISSLLVPPRRFKLGLYKFVLRVRMIGEELGYTPYPVESTAYTYVKIVATPLIPIMVQGSASEMVRGLGQIIRLQPGVLTIDPDVNENVIKNFSITWFCRRLGETYPKDVSGNLDESTSSDPIVDHSTLTAADDIGGCFGKGAGKVNLGGGDIALNTSMLWGPNITYEFLAIIETSSKYSNISIQVEVIEGLPPMALLRCEQKDMCFPYSQGMLFNPSTWIVLQADCYEDCGDNLNDIRYEWLAFTENLVNNTLTDITSETKNHTINDHKRFAINQTLYEAFPTVQVFRFSVKIYVPGKPAGSTSITLIRNKPPITGDCVLVPEEGRALVDDFTLNCTNWIDPEGEEISDYAVYLYRDGKYGSLVSFGKNTLVPLVLPFGSIEIRVEVSDVLGAVTRLSVINITTELPTQEEYEAWNETFPFDLSLNAGMTLLSGQIKSSEASVLSAFTKKKINDTLGYPSLADVAEVDGNIDPAVVDHLFKTEYDKPGIDSSYLTDQAQEELETIALENIENLIDDIAKQASDTMNKLSVLPMETKQDVEALGGVYSDIVSLGPLNNDGLKQSLDGVEKMREVLKVTDVPHPSDLKVCYQHVGNIMDSVVTDLTNRIQGESFVKSDLIEAENEISFDATEPNPFIFYVNGGSAKEAEAAKKKYTLGKAQAQSVEKAQRIVEEMKTISAEIKSNIMKKILKGEPLYEVQSPKGFYMSVQKKLGTEMTDYTVTQADATYFLPDACDVFHNALECSKLNETVIGFSAVKWSGVLESYGKNANKVSRGSNTIQLETSSTDSENATELNVTDTLQPIEMCIPQRGMRNRPSSSLREEVNTQNASPESPIFYHNVTLLTSETSVSIDIVPSNPDTDLIVLVKYGKRPRLYDYDFITRIQDMLEFDGVYNLFLSQYNQSEGGQRFFLGIAQLADHIDPLEFFNDQFHQNLTMDDITTNFTSNYSIAVYTSACLFFEESTETWKGDGCHVTSIDVNRTCCQCTHLTSFGSGFFVAPNSVDFDYVFANASFSDNLAIYITLIVTFSIYIILMIWARWKDKKDVEKLGAAPLPDNDVRDKYLYEIMVFTGHQNNAGTKSKVQFIASGDDDETEVRTLDDPKRQILRRNGVDVFVMAVPRSLGQLNFIRMWHDNSGKGKWKSWFLKYIVFRDVQTGHKFEFVCNRWFAVEEDDGMIDRLIPVAGKAQLSEFSHLFSTTSQKNLADGHLWFSVFTRPPRSRFTRVQRVSSCMALLYLSMLVNAMWYERTSDQPSPNAVKFGPFSLSPEQIGVGVMANLIVFPPSFLIILLFRKSRPRKLRPSRIEEALKRQREELKKNNSDFDVEGSGSLNPTGNKPAMKRKRKFTLPWWFQIIAWILVFICIGVSVFFLWAYGIQFGNEKTTKWVTSLVISFFTSILVTQPIKIFLTAMIVSSICKKIDYDEDDADEDEEDPVIASDEELLHAGTSREKRPEYKPMDLKALSSARQEREKELKMYNVLKEIAAYIFFLWILMVLSYGNRDPNSFYLRENLRNAFIKPGDILYDYHNVDLEWKFWRWTKEALIPELFIGDWYNNRPPIGLKFFLDDRVNLKIGYAVMRQVRVKPNSCKVPRPVQNLTTDCAGFANIIDEDGAYYAKGWRSNFTATTPIPPEYKYLTASQLKGYPFWGLINNYGGGGYVVPLFGKKDGVLRLMDRLQRTGWIGRHTRAIFIEFAVYNAQVNLFAAVTIVAEFVPGGGIFPYYHIDPMRLLYYHEGFGLFIIICEAIFLLFVIYFTVREIRAISRQKMRYFRDYWNVLEVVSLLLSYTGIVLYIYSKVLIDKILKIFTETEGTGYVKFQESVLVDQLFGYIIAFLMFIATLKFLKLLRFNKRMGILAATLRQCGEELKSYGVCLLVVFLAFVVLFWLTLGRYMWHFASFVTSFESSISMMLRKFQYEEMATAQPILTPIIFFTFSLATSIFLINILLTLIIQTFEKVKHDVTLQSNEYELLTFIMNRMRMFVGVGPTKVGPEPFTLEEDKKKENSLDSFPQKVEQFLQYVNVVCFDNQLDLNSKEFVRKMSNSEEQRQEERKKLKRKPPSVGDTDDDVENLLADI